MVLNYLRVIFASVIKFRKKILIVTMCRLSLIAVAAALCCSNSAGFVVNSGIVANKGHVVRGETNLNAIDLSFLVGQEHYFASSNLIAEASTDAVASTQPASYSQASYYTTLGLYLLSFPGIWSQIKRSTSAKVKRKTFVRYERSNKMKTFKTSPY